MLEVGRRGRGEEYVLVDGQLRQEVPPLYSLLRVVSQRKPVRPLVGLPDEVAKE